MLQQLRITPRLILLMVLQVVTLVTIGGIALRGLIASGDAMAIASTHANEQIALSEMNQVLRAELPATLDDVLAARITWEQGRSDVLAIQNLLASQWTEYQHAKAPQEIAMLGHTLAPSLNNVVLALGELDQLLADPDSTRLTGWRHGTLGRMISPFTTEIDARIAQQRLDNASGLKHATQMRAGYLYGGLAALVLALALIGVISRRVYQSILQPLRAIESTVRNAADGHHDVRVGLRGRDEFSMLGRSIDQILDERSANTQVVQHDQDQRHQSLALLLQTLTGLGARDFTARAPATDDATAPLAIAMNQLANDTGQILVSIRRIAEQLAKTSVAAHAHVDVMLAVYENETRRIEATRPAVSAKENLSQVCATVLQETTTATRGTLEMFTDTTTCLDDVNITLRATQTHAHQLRDQAQDIGGALEAFNAIAERAHVVSVNASMQALGGGDNSGRNAATTAGEMQHLAENIRDTTRHVATLMTRLQRAAVDHSALLDSAITQASATTQVARHAGEQLRQVHTHATNSVTAIRALDTASATVEGQHDDGAAQIQASMYAAHGHLVEQRRYTQRLTHFSRGLLTAVKSFSLPAEPPAESEPRQSSSDASPVALQQRAS